MSCTLGDITFEFRIEKLIHAIAFFSSSGMRDLTKLKIAKLLYYADKEHLLNHGSPILGDVYFCMDYGPVPSFALNEMNEAISRPEVPLGEDSDYGMMSKVLRVKKPFFSEPRFEAKHTYDASVFTQTEINALKSICTNYGYRSAGALVNLSHLDQTYIIANKARNPGSRSPIPYELFFEGAPESSRKYLAKLKLDFYGEVIPLASDKDYSEFAASLLSYPLEPDFDLDSEQIRDREALES